MVKRRSPLTAKRVEKRLQIAHSGAMGPSGVEARVLFCENIVKGMRESICHPLFECGGGARRIAAHGASSVVGLVVTTATAVQFIPTPT